MPINVNPTRIGPGETATITITASTKVDTGEIRVVPAGGGEPSETAMLQVSRPHTYGLTADDGVDFVVETDLDGIVLEQTGSATFTATNPA